jgi:hypothetical protein
MSAQSDNKMEDNNQQVAESKGKGKAHEAETMQESMDEDSSDESGVEDQVCLIARNVTFERNR